MRETNVIYCMDNVEGLRTHIPDNSIDLVVTSPPYDNIRDYKNNWSIDLPNLGKELSRVLVKGGMVVMVIQDQTQDGRKSLTSFKTIVNWCENTELDLWETCIYQRSGTPGAWWAKRFRVDHEYIPIFIKGKRPQHFDKEHMMIATLNPGDEKKDKGTRTSSGKLIKRNFVNGDKKCCGTIINYESYRNKDNKNKLKNKHSATFPDQLAKDFIKAFSKKSDIVLDPFMGSGTTAKMAELLNRQWVGFEISQEYVDIAYKRVGQLDKKYYGKLPDEKKPRQAQLF